ncbi:hypothetical protein, partial [Citrobacter gillenii]|uniref:hypothetical protein n=2 Tax=Citrobacter TaxID=544 RepID=UPI0022E52577
VSDTSIPRFESSYPSHFRKARFGELFAFLTPGDGKPYPAYMTRRPDKRSAIRHHLSYNPNAYFSA